MIGAPNKICPSCQARCRADAVYCATCGADVRNVAAVSGDPYLGLEIAGKYKVERLIGEGAMGRVYEAKQVTLDKPFAVKILAPHLMHDEQSHARFAAEAHNCASLNHPNVVSVVDYGRTAEGVTFIVMEFIKGVTLERIITEQYPLVRERIVDLTLQVLAALTEAHGLGILHRDLKPENILVQQLRTHGELAKVLDFGIAKLMDNPVGPGLTSAGMVCGTPEYMSPEQCRGHKLDARSDLYSVGVILYQMLAGRPPFESESAVEILHKHLHDAPVPPSRLRGTAPDPLEAVCLRAMSKDPAHRHASAMEFREEVIAASSAPRVAATIRCNTCGANLKIEHRFCPSCGAPAPSAEPSPSLQRRTSQTQLAVLDTDLGGPVPLVGRDRQLQAAQALLGRPIPGLRMRVLVGDRGMGKTRLVDEIADLAEPAGWRVYYVSTDPSGARTPLFPVLTMVAQVLELDPATCSTQDLFRAANLVGLGFEELPGLAELFRLQGPAHDLEHAVRRRECFASATQAMLAGGRGQPLLLVFEDIDGYDNASREVLRRLSRRRTDLPVLCLVTSKESSLDWLDGAAEVLEPLDEEAVVEAWRELAAQRTGLPLPPADIMQAIPMSPLRLEQCIRLAIRGKTAPAPAKDTDLLRIRVDAQPPAVKRLLELAAVLGDRFPQGDLIDLARRDPAPIPWKPEDLKHALDQAHGEGLVVAFSSKERGFAHRTLHDSIYAAIDSRRREQLHGVAADVSRVARLSTVTRAVHLVRARDPRAPEVLVQAALLAERSFDDPTAADFLNAALRLSAVLTGGTSRSLQAEVARHATRVMRSPEASTRAVELLRGEIDRATTPGEEAAVRCSLGVQLLRLEKWDEALEALHKALGPAMQADDRAIMVQITKEIAKVHAGKGDRKRAIRELREGLDVFTLGEGPRTTADLDLWAYLLRVCEMYRADDELQESRTWCEHALFQAERAGNHLGLMRCHGQMAWVLRDLDQLALAEQHLARALNEARHFGDRLTTTELLMERARARASRGRLAEALRYAEEALRLAQGIQWQTGIEHAERAINMLTQKEPPPLSAGPTEHSGMFDYPSSVRMRDQSGPFNRPLTSSFRRVTSERQAVDDGPEAPSARDADRRRKD
ncbi:protein kinase domain-containing protein [Paraliomyxa miuraensis]|uniref:protein kinase domain-containing protein n=1 Tax=Paraliomyxa miuraensis TaxID=376150 RepID=UPI002258DD6D|nr:protein kinase [Paraliomyxa miuraensis]MCX4247628.1 protein kinase [Paraliomyxa miuraensis]